MKEPSHAADQPLSAYMDHWLRAHVEVNLRPTTADSYRRLSRLHILPHLGELPLTELTPQRLQAWVADLSLPQSTGGRRLSPRTVTYAMAILRAALADAVRLGLLERNPFTRVRAPRPGPRVVASFTLEQVRRLDAADRDQRLGALFTFLWQSGLRVGEALALRWEDLDLEGASLRVRRNAAEVSGRLIVGPPKTVAGMREIALAPQTVSLLLRHLTTLKQEGLISSGLVFPSRAGTMLSRRNVTRAWAGARQRAGLPPYGLHALRHTNASLQLQAGVGIREIAAHLGHESPALTAKVYAHVLEDTKRQAARRLGELLDPVNP